MTRYARQTLLPDVGAEGQARLSRAHVLVGGAKRDLRDYSVRKKAVHPDPRVQVFQNLMRYR